MSMCKMIFFKIIIIIILVSLSIINCLNLIEYLSQLIALKEYE